MSGKLSTCRGTLKSSQLMQIPRAKFRTFSFKLRWVVDVVEHKANATHVLSHTLTHSKIDYSIELKLWKIYL